MLLMKINTAPLKQMRRFGYTVIPSVNLVCYAETILPMLEIHSWR